MIMTCPISVKSSERAFLNNSSRITANAECFLNDKMPGRKNRTRILIISWTCSIMAFLHSLLWRFSYLVSAGKSLCRRCCFFCSSPDGQCRILDPRQKWPACCPLRMLFFLSVSDMQGKENQHCLSPRILCFTASLFSKESAVLLPLLLILYFILTKENPFAIWLFSLPRF